MVLFRQGPPQNLDRNPPAAGVACEDLTLFVDLLIRLLIWLHLLPPVFDQRTSFELATPRPASVAAGHLAKRSPCPLRKGRVHVVPVEIAADAGRVLTPLGRERRQDLVVLEDRRRAGHAARRSIISNDRCQALALRVEAWFVDDVARDVPSLV